MSTNAYNSPRLMHVMKLIDLKLQADQLREEFANVVEDNHIAASRMFNKLLDDILYITVSCPGIRYWKHQPSGCPPKVWASTDAEDKLDPFGNVTEITNEEFQQIRRSEWAQLAPQPKEETTDVLKATTPDNAPNAR